MDESLPIGNVFLSALKACTSAQFVVAAKLRTEFVVAAAPIRVVPKTLLLWFLTSDQATKVIIDLIDKDLW